MFNIPFVFGQILEYVMVRITGTLVVSSIVHDNEYGFRLFHIFVTFINFVFVIAILTKRYKFMKYTRICINRY